MADARLRMTLDLDTAQARAEVTKFAEESARQTAQAFTAAERGAVAKSLGVRPNDPMVQQILQRGTMQGGPPPTVGPPPSIVAPAPILVGPSPAIWGQHAGGLQQMAHSARAVADTMLYRVNPALGEVHRAAAGMLLMSGNAMLMLAGGGRSAEAVIRVQRIGSLPQGREESEVFPTAVPSGAGGGVSPP